MSSGPADAQAVRDTLRRPPPAGRGRRAREETTPAPPLETPVLELNPEIVETYAQEVRTYYNELAKVRDWQEIPERAAGKIGPPAALVAMKWGLASKILRWPELALLLALAPYLLNAARVEWTRWKMPKPKAQKGDAPSADRGPAGIRDTGPAVDRRPPADVHYEGASFEERE